MSWQDQGRQEHGRFGTGTAGKAGIDRAGRGTGEAPSELGQRIDALGHSVVAHVPRAGRGHAALTFDDRALGRLRSVLTAWSGGSGLSRDAFRQRFLDPYTGDETVDLLRSAARGAAEARTHEELAAAGADLTSAMQRIGLNTWPRYLADAADRAGQGQMPDQTAPRNGSGAQPEVADGFDLKNQATSYIASDPRQWIGQPPVGSGECVPLVQRATGAPSTTEWRRGEPVQGNPTLAPGTAIATFDSNGRYGNHTNGSSHAAIYLGQDADGIRVIDQWTKRQHGQIIQRQAPHERTLYFNRPQNLPVDRGESYYAVRW